MLKYELGYNHPQSPTTTQKLPKKAKTSHIQLFSCTWDVNYQINVDFNSDIRQWYIYMCVWWYGKTRVTSYKLRVESIKSTSWNWKMQVQIHELRVQIHDLRVQIHELRVHIHELRVRIHELQVRIHELRVRIHEIKNHY